MYRSLLVATDGSARATKALKAAIRMARGSGAKLHVLNVQPPFISTLAGDAVPRAVHGMMRGGTGRRCCGVAREA